MSLARLPLPLVLCVALMVALCVPPGAADPRADRVERVANRGAAWDGAGAGAGVGVAGPVDRSPRYLSGAYCANVLGGDCKRTQTQLERIRRGPRPRQVLYQVPRQHDLAQPFAWEE